MCFTRPALHVKSSRNTSLGMRKFQGAADLIQRKIEYPLEMELLLELQRGQYSLSAVRLQASHMHLTPDLGRDGDWEYSGVKMT